MLFNFRIDQKIREELETLAKEHSRSKGNLIKYLISIEGERIARNRIKSTDRTIN